MKATNIRQGPPTTGFQTRTISWRPECIQYGIRVGFMLKKLKKTYGRNKERSYYALTTKTWKRCKIKRKS